ncbi:MAG: hypothetical protein HBSAPP03_04880 [Phycisphaerae bacterium]|nr:MAG: hypothetical protein HBSAPP03_04880 [Phycisphaerae bacterium]
MVARRILVVVGLLAAHAAGQTSVCLHPASFTVEAGRAASLRVQQAQGEGWADTNWPASVEWMFVRVAGTQANYDAESAPKPDGQGRVSITPVAAGVALIGLDMAADERAWEPAAIAAFAAKAGRADLCPNAPTPVRHVRSASALITVTEPASPAVQSAATGKSGLAVEIRPLMDPTAMRPEGDIPVRVYLGGEGAAGAVVRATHRASGAAVVVKADGKGIAALRIDQPGEWLVEFHVLREARHEGGPMEAFSGTLTFEAPPRPAGEDASALKPEVAP